MGRRTRTNALLGYPPDARLLIINADDFGMCYAENVATIRAVREGVASSCTLMVPCPWARHAMHLLLQTPSIPCGVHLTAVSEYAYYRWGPVTCPDQVPSLVDESGCFYAEDRIPDLLARLHPDELETEFRAQIEAVFDAGLRPTHLDSHCSIHLRDKRVFDLTFDLAREVGVALRVSGGSFIGKVRGKGYPTADHDVLDSYCIDAREKPAYYFQLLHDLPAGLTEWALHPALASAELQAITPTWPTRQADLDFLVSQAARDAVDEEGITILSYRALQDYWRSEP